MTRFELQRLVAAKQNSTEPLTAEETRQGFRGWYASKHLPHFDAPGTQQFITYRLAESLPLALRYEWKTLLQIEDPLEKQRRFEIYLDRGRGPCFLRDQRIAEMVQENLWHRDGKDYRLLAWVIMPNHVHVLVELWQIPLGKIIQNWKSYSSKRANAILGRTGEFWAEDYFDRYVRDETNCRQFLRYIENNPTKAKLVRVPEEWPWSSARFRSRMDLSRQTLTHLEKTSDGRAVPNSYSAHAVDA